MVTYISYWLHSRPDIKFSNRKELLKFYDNIRLNYPSAWVALSDQFGWMIVRYNGRTGFINMSDYPRKSITKKNF